MMGLRLGCRRCCSSAPNSPPATCKALANAERRKRHQWRTPRSNGRPQHCNATPRPLSKGQNLLVHAARRHSGFGSTESRLAAPRPC